MSLESEFEEIVNLHYHRLYQFALSLTHDESDAADLTQQTFLVWASKNHQLEDRSKAKTWLFTILHRDFLSTRRRLERFKFVDVVQVEEELPPSKEESASSIDAARVLEALAQVDEAFRAPLALFYLEDISYKEISEILGVPMGTVKSRLSRGIDQLQQLLGLTGELTVGESLVND